MHNLKLFSLMLCLAFAGCANNTIYVPTYNMAEPISQGVGEAALPDSGIYKGQFKEGLFDGKGKITWSSGTQYEGEFKSGLIHGHGLLNYANGDVYRGEFYKGSESGLGVLTMATGDRYEGDFKDGLFHGKGAYTAENGDTYIGDFLKGEFTGQGVSSSKNGENYEGQFAAWRMNGNGVLTLKNGDKYSGNFVDGEPKGKVVVEYKSGEVYKGELAGWLFQGKGLLTRKDGTTYEGEFSYGQFDGDGRLTVKGGEKYVGKFKYGFYHGEGTLEYRDKNGEINKLTGRWENGRYAGDDAADYVKEGLARLNAEQLLYGQAEKIEAVLSGLTPQVSGQPDLYFVGFGSYGSEDVFMKEVRYSSEVMNKLYDIDGRTINLINNPKTADEVPLATVTNLEVVLNGVAKQMDVDEDILFLYVTSHGSKEHEISVSLDGVPLQDLSANRFKQIVKDSGIKWKVLVLSACYSGGFIDALKDDTTLVLTAARADRQSFGCGDDSSLTYFGRAFFEKSLTIETSFIEAFEHARDLVSEWEKKEKREPSEPQINSTSLIEKKLAEWRGSIVRQAN